MSVKDRLTVAQSGVETWVRKNRKNFRVLEDCCSKNTEDPIQYGVIFWNIWTIFYASPLFKTLTPLMLVLAWNACSQFLPDEIALQIARLGFLAKNAATLYVMFQIRSTIRRKMNDGEMDSSISVEKRGWTNEGTMENMPEPMSIGTYDEEQLFLFFKTQGFSVAFMMFLHWRYMYTSPLVAGSVMGFLQLKDLPLFRIHVRGEDATSDVTLKRPFRADDFMSTWNKAMIQYQNQNAGPAGPAEKKVSAKSLKIKEKQQKSAEKKKN